jgi:hypothetical protein
LFLVPCSLAVGVVWAVYMAARVNPWLRLFFCDVCLEHVFTKSGI